jgi:hypothetical protein
MGAGPFVRILIGSVILGGASYTIGTLVYNGLRPSTFWLRTLGAAAGLAPGLLLIGVTNWPVAAIVAIAGSITSSILFSFVPELQDVLRKRLSKSPPDANP